MKVIQKVTSEGHFRWPSIKIISEGQAL